MLTGRSIILVALSYALTPASHLPRNETHNAASQTLGIGVADLPAGKRCLCRVPMGQGVNIEKVRMQPNEINTFTQAIEMLVSRSKQGLGNLS